MAEMGCVTGIVNTNGKSQDEGWYRAVFLIAVLAYLDPGSGSSLIQAVVALILSLGYLTRRFWKKLICRLTGGRFGTNGDGNDQSGSA